MCGRVVSARPADELAAFFRADNAVAEEPSARYNVAPTDEVYAVSASVAGGGRRLGTMRWGLVPPRSGGPGSRPRPINARVETVLAKPVFADAVARRRCLVPVDGFYEWRRLADGSKQPHFLAATDGSPLALAGLWERWRGDDGTTLVTCAVLTTEANALVRPLHDRMPAIVAEADWDVWLDRKGTDASRAVGLLAPAPDDLLCVRPASRLVNSVANDGPHLLSA